MAMRVYGRAWRLLLGLVILGAGGALSCIPDVAPTAEAECSPGERRCASNMPETCGNDLQWLREDACSGDTPFCANGACSAEPASCASLTERCGTGSESCCTTLPVVKGNFLGGATEEDYFATVFDFKLDKFEVTVGRFRQFVAEYHRNMPSEGDGAHFLIPGSGWRKEWSESLPKTPDALKASLKCSPDFLTWTDERGPNESLPINCVSWFVAFAFCAWDGGRLPTNAEWNYTAAGAMEQRPYPWGADPPSPMRAAYGCTADGSPAQDCAFNDILAVGSLPQGDGRFGQADMAGSMFEWALDWFGVYSDPCIHCANIDTPDPDHARTAWGGDWSHEETLLFSYSRLGYSVDAETPTDAFHGLRCARDM